MANPLMDGPARSSKSKGATFDPCPVGYADAHRWCAWANSEKSRDDVFWRVGSNGTPILVDDEDVCGEMHRRDRALKEREAQKHNHRLTHPVTEQRAA